MYSASIYKEDFLKIKRLVKTEDSRLASRLDECNKQLLALKRDIKGSSGALPASHCQDDCSGAKH